MSDTAPVMAWPYRWHSQMILPERLGASCRIVSRGERSTVCVEFEDGLRVTTSRFAVRRR